MGLIKEPKNVDFSTKSEPWTEKELNDFRKIMQGIKEKNAKRKIKGIRNIKKTNNPADKSTNLQPCISASSETEEQ